MTDLAITSSDLPLGSEGPGRLLSPEEEGRLFTKLQFNLAKARLRDTLAKSRLRIALVIGLSLFFWGGLFTLFHEGFRFLATHVGSAGELHASTVHFIYFSFFSSLMIMLIFSSAIIIYGGLYRSRETQFLLTLPVRAHRIVLYKFQESLLFSSWGFFLLGSPMLVAYGVSSHSPWHYYALILPYMLSFVFLPCAIGSILCMLIVYSVPRVRTFALGVTLCSIVIASLAFVWSFLGSSETKLLTPEWFKEILGQLSYVKIRLLPSWWLSTGLLEAGRVSYGTLEDNPLAESIKLLAALLSNSMLAYLVLLHIGERTLRQGYSSLHGEGQHVGPWTERIAELVRSMLPERLRRKRAADGSTPWQPPWLDRAVLWLVRPLPWQVRYLLVKDLQVFRRDPVQWSQVLILLGLMGLYFINIRRFSYGEAYAVWVNMVSFLNLAVVGLILSTFTTRFIFPMISLEGSRFWILGLLPIHRDAILWGKFLFAAAGSIVPCTMLILLSDLMLGISTLVVLVHQLTCVIVCIGLSAIAVGLGAKMPDLREQSPSKIAAGFGGTLNLVISAIYIVTVVMLTALPCHFYIGGSAAGLDFSYLLTWVYAGVFASIGIGILATVVPIRMGLKAFRELEF
jgi:ABC-2 type transport system permease protein